MMDRKRACCFIGHRKLPKGKIGNIVKRLDQEIDNLISQGVTDFISGGALGFDQIAASLIVAKKEMGHSVRLIFALPCTNQDKKWKADQKRLYHNLLAEADEVIYVSEEYANGCMKKRNRFMVDNSAYCICARLHGFSGTDQTAKYAKQKSVRVINIAE
ncbi:MAG: DUF1273 domain-containing protein [Oscillospiraceae bacterium]|nr:DUF1273 domain-containing protein [Oscillospiraceae bacterium]